MSDQEKTRIYSIVSIGPGTQLNGLYEIDELIASGGMGEVYLGHEMAGGHKVAIKIVLQELARDQTILMLFNKEASTLRDFYNPAIVRYMAFGTDPVIGRSYMVTEYIDGPSLATRLESGPLEIEETRLLVGRLASGLDAAHQHGVIHRDMSADNVLLAGGKVEQAKIIDFGIARNQKSKTLLDGKFAGKYNFVSPEQLGMFSGEVTGASDVYSLGLLTVNALRGKPIDMGGTQVQIIEKRRVVPDLSDIDESVRPVVELMLQPDPADRQITMADIAELFLPQKEFSRPPRPRFDALKARTAPPGNGAAAQSGDVPAAAAAPIPASSPPVSAPPGIWEGNDTPETAKTSPPAAARKAEDAAPAPDGDRSAPPAPPAPEVSAAPVANVELAASENAAPPAAKDEEAGHTAETSGVPSTDGGENETPEPVANAPEPEKGAVKPAPIDNRTVVASPRVGEPPAGNSDAEEPAAARPPEAAAKPQEADRTRFMGSAAETADTRRIKAATPPESRAPGQKASASGSMPRVEIPAFDAPSDPPEFDPLPLSPRQDQRPERAAPVEPQRPAPAPAPRRSGNGGKIAAALAIVAMLGGGGAWYVSQQVAGSSATDRQEAPRLTPGSSSGAAAPAAQTAGTAPEGTAGTAGQTDVQAERTNDTAAAPPVVEEAVGGETETAALPPDSAVTSARDSLSAASSQIAWVNEYDGGPCFFARTLSAGENTAAIEGMGAAQSAFETMYSAFQAKFGFEPNLELRPIVDQQCAIADALANFADDEIPTVRLALDNDRIKSGIPLKGEITGLSEPNVVLYLIDNDGFVYQIDQFMKRSGDQGTFNIKLVELETRDPLPQVVLAVASDRPIRGSALAEPALASDLFPKLVEAVRRDNVSVEYAFSYFELGGQ